MKPVLGLLLLFSTTLTAMADPERGQLAIESMLETLQARIEEAANIVDISIYEQEWVKPDAASWKGRLIRRGIVTHVHTGKIPLGTRVEFTYFVEESPKLFDNFRSTVEGELRTLFFSDNETTGLANGRLKIEGDGHWGFERVGDTFAELFAKELESNPKLRRK
ncbi:hypothetical protein OJ996_01915 [Luteolibacter sp. GHJ8]|uniref:SnoaL-like domain-containing protein n=1 Tax=Luteolibacter rhizosphaerae TaxID=2989719 RepID=A0ABT3FXK1_9BACT|nr:hypothetical protein [Luteolibacter rhizosphaerae]MCW1912310.1 hypothetical protein [Luteolibacter rhizosphaerae]